jgi:hypothetical protein
MVKLLDIYITVIYQLFTITFYGQLIFIGLIEKFIPLNKLKESERTKWGEATKKKKEEYE